MLAVDLDGTLLDDDRVPVAPSAAALRKAESQGIHIVLASGRTVASLRPFAEQIGINPSFVACNGAYVVDSEGTEILHAPVPTAFQSEVIHYAQKRGINLNVYSRNEVFDATDGPWRDLYVSRVTNVLPQRRTFEELEKVSATKLLLVDRADKIVQYGNELRDRCFQNGASQTVSEPEYLEILAANIHKAAGLAALAGKLGVPQASIAAIGDFFNDLEMLAWAGFSAAVGNATPEVKKVAQIVVSSNTEGGVAEFVASFVHNL